MPDHIKNKIVEHLSPLQSEIFLENFLEITNKNLDFVRNPFRYSVEKVADARMTFEAH